MSTGLLETCREFR